MELVLHAGDIMGSGPCTDRVYRERFDLFQQFHHPFIYTIGDNEWTDCHREENGQYYPLERLDFLRSVFFSNPSRSSGGRPIPVRSQSAIVGFEPFVEHMIFFHNRIVFGTLHVVGSNNGLAPWSGIDPDDAFDHPRRDRLEEFEAREKAATHWLTEIFRVARESESPGIVVLIQANPGFELAPDEEGRAGFNTFVKTLGNLMLESDIPVLLAHGHIHYLLIDKPFHPMTIDGHEEKVRRLIRVQTPGSPFVRWVKVTIDPQSPEVFHFVSPYLHKMDGIPW